MERKYIVEKFTSNIEVTVHHGIDKYLCELENFINEKCTKSNMELVSVCKVENRVIFHTFILTFKKL